MKKLLLLSTSLLALALPQAFGQQTFGPPRFPDFAIGDIVGTDRYLVEDVSPFKTKSLQLEIQREWFFTYLPKTDGFLRLDEHATAPGTPATGSSIIYSKQDGLWYSKDDAGVETLMSGGAGSGGAFTADVNTQIAPTTPIVLDLATGNEPALHLPVEVNKATSGYYTGLFIDVTETAAPETDSENMLIEAYVGGAPRFYVDAAGSVFGIQLIKVTDPATWSTLQMARTNAISGTDIIGRLEWVHTGAANAAIDGVRDGFDDATALVFKTAATGGALTERLRIAATGAVTSAGALSASNLSGTNTGDQTAAGPLTVVTTAFNTNFANDASHDTVQELMDIIDDFALGGATAFDNITDPSGVTTINFQDSETVAMESLEDGGTFWTFHLTKVSIAQDTVGVLITATDNDDANYIPFLIQDDAGGTPDDLFKVDYQGNVTAAGNFAPASVTTDSLRVNDTVDQSHYAEFATANLTANRTFTLPGDAAATLIGSADTGTVTSTMITDGTVAKADLATAATAITTKSTAVGYTVGETNSKEFYGGVIYVTGASTILSPASADGASFTVITIGNIAVSVDVDANDDVYLDGTLLDDGDKVTNTSNTGDLVVFTYIAGNDGDGGRWYAASNGWTDGGP